jgi:hypothetical protein
MNLNCTTGPATRPCTSLWSQGVYRSRSFSPSRRPLSPRPILPKSPTGSNKPKSQHPNISSHQSVEPPHGGARTTDFEMHVGTSVTYTQRRLRQAAQPTHNSPLTLTLTHWPHGARTLGHAPTHPTPREATRHRKAAPPNCARGVAPNRLDVAQPIPNQP